MVAGGGALLAAVAVGFGLASGLDLDVVRKASQAIAALAIAASPPTEPVAPQNSPSDIASGKASAANQHAKAAPIIASKPKLPPITPPVAAAPHPGTGSDASAGATPNPGAGSGAGGRGDGTGAGGSGNGTGGGTKAVWQSGTIRDRDYPRSAAKARAGGAVVAFFDVQVNGRATNCRISESSGNADLDATTCRLIEKRFRYRPAVDAQGRPVVSEEGWRQTWWLEER